jgi:hypothetical protein
MFVYLKINKIHYNLRPVFMAYRLCKVTKKKKITKFSATKARCLSALTQHRRPWNKSKQKKRHATLN